MRLFVVLLMAATFLLTGCFSREGDELPLPKVPSDPTVVATQVPPAYTAADLVRNTVLFKQETGFAVDTPYQGQEFYIEYEGPLTAYYVWIETNVVSHYRQVKTYAEQVFKNAGSGDLCGLRIFFFAPKTIEVGLNQADIFATGCKPLF